MLGPAASQNAESESRQPHPWPGTTHQHEYTVLVAPNTEYFTGSHTPNPRTRKGGVAKKTE